MSDADIFYLSTIVLDEVYGEELDDPDERLFRSIILDETDPTQAELTAKIGELFEAQDCAIPDRVSLQFFRRKAGFRTTRNEPDFGNYCMAMCLKDYQIVVFDKEEYFLQPGQTSPYFELLPHPTSKKEKQSPRPFVPAQRTQYKRPNGKSSLKERNYSSILLWAFWEDHPTEMPKMPVGLEEILANYENQLKEDSSDDE